MVKLFSKKVIKLDFYSFRKQCLKDWAISFETHRLRLDKTKAPVAGSFKVNWCGV